MNSFDSYSSKIKGVNIPLPSFVYNNKTSYDKQGKLIGRNLITERLKSWLLEENGGSYLVTGYRGMGKTSFVNRVTNEISSKTSYIKTLVGYALLLLAAISIIDLIVFAVLSDKEGNSILFTFRDSISDFLKDTIGYSGNTLFLCSALIVFVLVFSALFGILYFYPQIKDFCRRTMFWVDAKKLYKKEKGQKATDDEKNKISKGLSDKEWNWITYRIYGEVLKEKKHSRIIVNVNLGQEILDVRSILCVLTSQLYTEYKKRFLSPFGNWYMWASLFLGLGFTTIGICYILQHLGSNLSQLPKLTNDWNAITVIIVLSITVLVFVVIAKMILIIFPPIDILMRLKILAMRINASMEKGVNFSASGSGGDIKSSPGVHSIFHYGIATTREIESQLISILDYIQHFRIHPKIIFVFDELDKIESTLRPAESSQEFTQDKYHPGGGTSRKRRSTVLHLLSNMKYLTSTARAKFVFIAGREMYDSYLADLTDRESAISSIFNGVIYVESFCKNEKKEKDGMYNVETFVCRQLLPEEYIRQQFMHEYIRCKLHDQVFNNIDINLKMYYKYLQTKYDECIMTEKVGIAIKPSESPQTTPTGSTSEINNLNEEVQQAITILNKLKESINEGNDIYVMVDKTVTILNQLLKSKNENKDNNDKVYQAVSTLKQLLDSINENKDNNGNENQAVSTLNQLQNAINNIDKVNQAVSILKPLTTEYRKEIADKEIERTIHLLNRFVFYLYQISNGSPKKIRLALEKFVRPVSCAEDAVLTEKNIERFLGKPNEINILTTKSNYQLSFGPKEQNVFEFIHYITFPINQILTDAERYGDKLLVSASFLTDHIYKYHTGAFSWNNLEQTPELLESFKIPELRTFINSILEYLTNTHLVKIQSGLFQYKFRMQITEEISMMSKVSEEIASIFNFTRDESQLIRQHYVERRDYFQDTLNREGNHSHHAIAGHHHIMGDLYMAEEDYNYAIIEYNAAISALRKRTSMSKNDSLSLLRNYLKLGLAYEKRNTYNSAYSAYSDALATKLQNDSKVTLYQEEKLLVYQTILAKLFVQEKLENGGISKADIESAENDYEKIAQEKDGSYILDADFYMRLGDIMFYKNGLIEFNADTTVKSSTPIDKCAFYENCKNCPKRREVHWKKYRGLPCYAASYYFQSLKTIVSHLSNGTINSYDPISVFKNLVVQKGAAKTLRQNHITQMAEVLDCLGNTMLSCADGNDGLGEDFLKMYLGAMGYMNKNMDLPDNFNNDNIEKEIKYLEGLKEYKPGDLNRLEWALLYYWEAAITFRFVRDYKKASDCLKKILLVILNKLRAVDQFAKYSEGQNNEHEFKTTVGGHLDNIKTRIVRQCLICLYAHYEFINIVEIQRLKWIFYTQMYEYISLNRLSLFPDVEEIMLIYYEMLLLCPKNETNHANDKLAAIYNSMSLGSMRHTCTTYENIMALRFKSELNEYIMSLAFPSIHDTFKSKCSVDERQKGFVENILAKHTSDTCDAKVNKFFKSNKGVFTVEERFELLEFLIIDSIYCLTHILESVSPSPLFTHSFIGSTYRKINRWNILFDTLFYCYKIADEPNTECEHHNIIFNFIKSKSGVNKRGDESGKSFDWQPIKKAFNCKNLSDRFFGNMLNAINKPNSHLLMYVYSGEKALTEFRCAREMHREGKSYKNMLSNIYFLDDDLNNDALQFNLAIERYVINNDIIDHYIKESLDTLTKSIYDIDKYAEDQEQKELPAEGRFIDLDWNVYIPT